MRGIKFWPHLTIFAIVCALVAGTATALWVRYEQKAKAESVPSAARLQRVEGEVGINHSLADEASNSQWEAATTNTPISVGDRLYTRENARTAIAFTGRNFARLDPNSSLDLLSLSTGRTQVALRDGSALFDVASLNSGELFEVATPCGAIDLNQPGLYQIGIDNHGNATATAFSGVAQIVGERGTGKIEKGESLTVPCQAGSQAVVSRVEPSYAGILIDDYYSYRYPRLYDHRYRDYDVYLNDPDYYDPYRRYASYQYVSEYIPGLDDLDYYGNWEYLDNYGYCWHPTVDYGWAPYQSGYWTTDYLFGPTWVSYEPWGYAPYHYGRWSYFSDRWYWVPERVDTVPAYSPALVAFIPLTQADAIGWVPLGPGDSYVPRYYGPNWQVHLLGRPGRQQFVNLGVPNAVTLVQTRNFDQVIDRRTILRTDPKMLAGVHPVTEPLAVESLRQTTLRTSEVRRRIDVPPSVVQHLSNTRVITSRAPIAAAFRNDLTQRLRVDAASARSREQQLQVRDNRQTAVSRYTNPAAAGRAAAPSSIAAEQARERQMAALAAQSARGDRNARRQMQQLEREQRQAGRLQPQVERSQNQSARGERVGQQAQRQIEASPQRSRAQVNEGRPYVQSRRQQAPTIVRSPGGQQSEIRRGQQRGARAAEGLRPQFTPIRPTSPTTPRSERPQEERRQQRPAQIPQRPSPPAARVIQNQSPGRQQQQMPQQQMNRRPVAPPAPPAAQSQRVQRAAQPQAPQGQPAAAQPSGGHGKGKGRP